MQIIPAVDVYEGQVVRLLRGAYDAVTVYHDDPVGQARRWIDQGADLVHVVDLAGARSGTPDTALWEAFGAAGIPFQVGGGVRSVDLAVAAMQAGAARVVMGSAAVWHPAILGEVVERLGAERVVAAVDVRDGRATGAGWTDQGRPLDAVLGDVVAAGVRWTLATGISRDGTMAGPDLDLVREIQRVAPGLAVMGSGGVGSLTDLQALAAAGAEAVIVGRALYDGRFTFTEALNAG